MTSPDESSPPPEQPAKGKEERVVNAIQKMMCRVREANFVVMSWHYHIAMGR